jgi:hypothetical protein
MLLGDNARRLAFCGRFSGARTEFNLSQPVCRQLAASLRWEPSLPL